MRTAAQPEYTRPWLYPKQQAALFCDARYSIIEASTKSGKTVGMMVWLGEEAMAGERGQQYWWVAPVYPQARIAYRRVRDGLPASVRKASDSAMTITLLNGAVIVFKSGEKPDNLYGEDVHAMVIDEATRLREEAWHACRSTITATKGPVRIGGNVRGKKNWAYRMARRAEAGAENMEYHKITADDAVRAGVLEADEITDAESMLPKEVFRQLYYAEATDDEGNPFGAEAIELCVGPLTAGAPEAWGWDLAKSADWTAGIGLDDAGSVCRFRRFQQPWGETVKAIREETGGVPALIDSTGVGDPIVERLQREGSNQIEGFIFTAASKQRLMEGLAAAIQHREVVYPEGPIAIELRQFEYVYTRTGVHYAGAEGTHDDCVCALALAVAMRERSKGRQRWVPVETVEQVAEPVDTFWEA